MQLRVRGVQRKPGLGVPRRAARVSARVRTVRRDQNGIAVIAFKVAAAQRVVLLSVLNTSADDVVILLADGRERMIVASNLGFQMQAQTVERHPTHSGNA